MSNPDFFEFGKLIRTHGHKGWLRGRYEGRHPEKFRKLESVFLLMQEQPVPFFVEGINWEGDRFMIKIADYDSLEKASELIGKRIFLPAQDLPELEDGDYFLHELIGLEVIDQNDASIGSVISFFDQTPQEMIEVDHQGKRLLLPLTEEIVNEIDIDGGKIKVTLPEGYIQTLLS